MFIAGVAAATGDPTRDISIQNVQSGSKHGILIHAVIGIKEQFSGIQNMETDSFKEFLASKLAQNGISGAKSQDMKLDYHQGKEIEHKNNIGKRKVKQKIHNITKLSHQRTQVYKGKQAAHTNHREVIGILLIVCVAVIFGTQFCLSKQDSARVHATNGAMPDGEEESTPILFQQNSSGYAMPYDDQSDEVDQSMASPI